MTPFPAVPRLLAAFALASLAATALAAPLEPTLVSLDNGMRVVLEPDSLATGVDAALWFPAGTRHERPAQAGLALLAARLAFRGGDGDPLAPLAAVGGTGNLVVTPDFTSFSATVGPEDLESALDFLDHRLAGAATTPAALAAERAAIRAERARVDRTPVARGLARLWAAAWPGHPYAQTGAPPAAISDALAPADVDAWRRQRFTASSAVLTLAGAFDREAALAAVRRRFAGRARVAPPAAPALAAPRAGTRASERIESPARLCLVGWRGPGAADPDSPALELLAAWLGGGTQAPLVGALVRDWKLAVAAQAGYTMQKDGSLLWTLAVVPAGVDSAAVESTLRSAVSDATRAAPPAFELERARRQLESSRLFALQTAHQRALALGEGALLAGDAANAAHRLDALRRVTPEDLKRAAARVLTDAGRATVWMLPASPGGAR